ncbi:MAG: hypothetical protein JXR03_09260 [Cyclobacteriaceae bacterium]
MKPVIEGILADHANLSESLNYEDTLLALSCAQRVLDHLKRHLEREGNSQYETNISLVENIIENHRMNLKNTQGWSELKVSA